jgi:hypothetical protein
MLPDFSNSERFPRTSDGKSRKGDRGKISEKPVGIAAVDHEGRDFWVVAAEREDAGRFIVQADQELPAFLELESAIQTHRHNHVR